MLKLLIRTLVTTFYQQHVGMFLVVLYLLFGLIKGQDLIDFHTALLISICASPLNLMLVLVLWILYTLKSVFFVKQKLNLETYHFMKTLTILFKKKQYSIWFKTYFLLLLPILIYAILLLTISLKQHYYLTFLTIVIALATLILIAITATFNFSNFSFRPKRRKAAIRIFKFNKPFWLWPLAYLFEQQSLMLLICKIVSLVFFKAILLVFADVGNDIRVYLTAILAVVISHTVLVFNLVKFNATYCTFVQALPISEVKKLTYKIIIFTILLLPEFLALTWVSGFNVLLLLNALVFALGGLLFLETLVYFLKADMERYLKYLLFFFFTSMLAILAVYYLVFSVAISLIAIGVMCWGFKTMALRDVA